MSCRRYSRYLCFNVVGGDLNVHVHNVADADAVRLADILTSFNMVQRVTGPTHRCGGTLDVVITGDDYVPTAVTVDPPGVVSDHALVCCQLPVMPSSAPDHLRTVRSWRTIDRASLSDAIRDSALGQPMPSPPCDVDEMFNTYDAVLRDIADRFAPEHTVRCRSRPLSPWFDADCRAARRHCRRLERRYRRRRRAADQRAFVAAMKDKLRLFTEKKDAYWLERVRTDGSLANCGVLCLG